MTTDGPTQRLDVAVVSAGLVPTRSRARDLIARGFVSVDGVIVRKAGATVSHSASLRLADDAPDFVSRGAEKLSAALDHFGFEVPGRIAIDIGASTGGFTEVLLRRGARRVYAVDVGTSQLHSRLKDDRRVVSLEGVDARRIDRSVIPEDVTALVADLSFISLTKALGAPLQLTGLGAWLIALVKPQFEAGPGAVGKGGIVSDPSEQARSVREVAGWLSAQPEWDVVGTMPSPIVGGDGNQEFLLGAVRGGR